MVVNSALDNGCVIGGTCAVEQSFGLRAGGDSPGVGGGREPPGVSAPAAYGIALSFVERAVKIIMASGKVKMADIAEVNPTYDTDQRSCKVAARLLATIIEQHLFTL